MVASLKARAYGKMAVRDRYADIKTRLATELPIIVDGGASNESMTEAFLRDCHQSPSFIGLNNVTVQHWGLK